jgi:hypothetical protein
MSIYSVTCHESTEHSFFNLCILGSDTVLITQKAVWALGPIWRGAGNLASTMSWTLDLSTRSS